MTISREYHETVSIAGRFMSSFTFFFVNAKWRTVFASHFEGAKLAGEQLLIDPFACVADLGDHRSVALGTTTDAETASGV